MPLDASGAVQDLCAEVPAAKQLFDQASEILGYDLLQICTEGETARCASAIAFEHAVASFSAPYLRWPDLRWPNQQSLRSVLDPVSAGPKEKLNSTAVSQPAIYVASLAAVEKLKQDEGDVSVLFFFLFCCCCSYPTILSDMQSHINPLLAD